VFNTLLADVPPRTDPWVWLGQLAIIVTIIAGLVTVVWFFWTVLPAWLKPLKVEFRITDYPSSPLMEDAFGFLSPEKFKLTFGDKLPPRVLYEKAITILTIKNTGRKIQTNVSLSIDGANYFLIKKNDWASQIAKGQVSLGDMQGHDEIEVCSWGRVPYRTSGWLKVRSNEGPAAIKYRPWEAYEKGIMRRNSLYALAITGVITSGVILALEFFYWWVHR
jgi:hypothetical protein